MVLNKKSFKHRALAVKVPIPPAPGREFGAIIQNDPKNYPKTGQWKNQYPVATEKCAGCGLCGQYCPEGAISIQRVDGKNRAVFDMRFCKGEGLCAKVCPLGVIKMVKK